MARTLRFLRQSVAGSDVVRELAAWRDIDSVAADLRGMGYCCPLQNLFDICASCTVPHGGRRVFVCRPSGESTFLVLRHFLRESSPTSGAICSLMPPSTSAGTF